MFIFLDKNKLYKYSKRLKYSCKIAQTILQYLYARNLDMLSRYDSINLIEKCRIRDYGDFIFSVLGARGLSKSLRHYIDNKGLDSKVEDGTNDENDIKNLK